MSIDYQFAWYCCAVLSLNAISIAATAVLTLMHKTDVVWII